MNQATTENHVLVRTCGSRDRLARQMLHVPTKKAHLADHVRRELLQFAGWHIHRDDLEAHIALRIDQIVVNRTEGFPESYREATRAYYRELVPRYVEAMIEVPLAQRLGRSVGNFGWDFLETFTSLRRFPWIRRRSHG